MLLAMTGLYWAALTERLGWVRVEVRDGTGKVYRDLWDATATISVGGLTVAEITMYNGIGSALVTFADDGNFTLTADVNGLLDSDDLVVLDPTSAITASGVANALAGPRGCTGQQSLNLEHGLGRQ